MITLVSFDEGWADTYQELEAELSNVLGSHNPRIEHIGSTSVAGLAAQPTVDVLVGVRVDATLVTSHARGPRYLGRAKKSDKSVIVTHSADPDAAWYV